MRLTMGGSSAGVGDDEVLALHLGVDQLFDPLGEGVGVGGEVEVLFDHR